MSNLGSSSGFEPMLETSSRAESSAELKSEATSPSKDTPRSEPVDLLPALTHARTQHAPRNMSEGGLWVAANGIGGTRRSARVLGASDGAAERQRRCGKNATLPRAVCVRTRWRDHVGVHRASSERLSMASGRLLRIVVKPHAVSAAACACNKVQC